MKNKPLILAALLGLAFTLSPAAFAGERDNRMSDMQHKKHMGGLHHPKDGTDAKNTNASSMSDVQHRKHMGGLRHPEDGEKDGEARLMSDPQHRKHMGGLHHPSSEGE